MSSPGDEYEQEASGVAQQVIRGPAGARAGANATAAQPSFCFGRIPASPLGPALQCKLAVGQVDDPLEREADRVAEQVMAASNARATFSPLSAAGGGAGEREPPPAVSDVLGRPGEPLDAPVRRSMESRFGFDFSRVRIHTDARAAESAQALNARAYTVRDHIVFAQSQYAPAQASGQKLLAHELAHVVQQSAAGAAPRLARQPAPQPQHRPTAVDDAMDAVKNPSPESFAKAAGELAIMPMPDMLKAAEELRARGGLDNFITLYRVYEVTQKVLVTARVPAALYTVRWSHSDAGKSSSVEMQLVSEKLNDLDPGELTILFAYLNKAHPNAAKALRMAEGQAALAEAKTGPEMTVTAHVPAGAGMGAHATLPSIGPGKWNLPGEMDPGLYIGIEAHNAIALVYDEAHPGDKTFYNTIEMSTILRAAARAGQVKTPDALTEKETGLKPDITNLTKHHLYEIKPVDQRALGRAEMKMYLAMFRAAGVPMVPGPTDEDGTMGAFPAPDGVFLWQSPEPGVIIYRYRKGSLVPELVYDEATATEAAGERWRYVLKPEQKAIAVGAVSVGAMLIIAILLIPVGA